MKVIVYHYQKDIAYGNILWYPKRRLSQKEHPCRDNKQQLVFENLNTIEQGGNDILSKFRDAGYHASCFPEGDGIAFKQLNDQSEEQIEKDITEILGFEIVRK